MTDVELGDFCGEGTFRMWSVREVGEFLRIKYTQKVGRERVEYIFEICCGFVYIHFCYERLKCKILSYDLKSKR